MAYILLCRSFYHLTNNVENMSQKDFKIINESGKVSVVRIKGSTGSKHIQTGQRIRVMCFDSAQIDRIFKIQEQSIRTQRK